MQINACYPQFTAFKCCFRKFVLMSAIDDHVDKQETRKQVVRMLEIFFTKPENLN